MEQAELIDLGFNGEPLLHPLLGRFLEKLSSLPGKRKVFIVTNGTLLEEEICECLVENQLDYVVVSIDGATERTFGLIRPPASLGEVLRNLEVLLKVRQRRGSMVPELRCNFVAFADNVRELPAVLRLLSGLGVSTVYVNNVEPYFRDMEGRVLYREGEKRKLAEGVFRAARQVAVELGIELRLPLLEPDEHMDCAFLHPCVSWDGVITPCPALSYRRSYWFLGERAEYPRLQMGKVEEGFELVWQREAYRHFRRGVLVRDWPSVCGKCLRRRGIICPVG
jgi:MoaA/NifB/PqqE/SkfB family radical SAM enzyme